MEDITERITNDISAFEENLKVLNEHKLGPQEEEILRMAKNYRDDAKSWLEKKDFYSAFASISYAHGLLDALLKINAVPE